MKYFASIAVWLLLWISVSATAQPAPDKKTIEQMVSSMSEAFAGKTLGTLDAGKP